MVKFRKSLDSLAGKLIMAVGVMLTVSSVLFAFVLYQYERRVTEQNLIQHAHFSADLVRHGLLNGMLTADPAFIKNTVKSLGSPAEVKEIIVYDNLGRAVYSDEESRVGSAIDSSDVAQSALKGIDADPVITKAPSGINILKHYLPLVNEPACHNAACHFHKADGPNVLGVLYTSFSAPAIESARHQSLIGTLAFWAFFIICMSFSLCIILYNLVSKPVAILENGMKRLASGDMDSPINIKSKDEMGILAESFNTMALDIRRYREKMENWTHELEDEVKKKTDEIVKAHEQLIDAEKLASLGRMAAGVAHELNSPLTGILTFAHLVKERVPESNAEMHEDLNIIIEQANRCSKIIKGLLGFSRKGSTERLTINLNDLIENSVSIVRAQTKFCDISINADLDKSLPPVVADPNQIQQVIFNLYSNAADAVGERGTISISTRAIKADDRDYVEMEFSDTGPGIIPEHLTRIFEPFFTTKPVGKGTGLGLPVSYGIIKRHGGDILVKSKAGKGTTFLVRLPVVAEDTAGAQQG